MTEDAPDRSGNSAAPVLGAVAVGVVAVAVALLWPQPHTSLTQPSSGQGTIAATAQVPHTKSGTGYRLVAAPICVGHGTVTISDVQPHAPLGSIHVVDWAVSLPSTSGPPNPQADRTEGRAREVTGYANRAVTSSCGDPQYIAISVDRSSDIATAHGFDVTSSSGTIRTRLTVTLCATTCP